MLNSFAPQNVFTLSGRCLVVVVRCVALRSPSLVFSLSFRVLFCVAPRRVFTCRVAVASFLFAAVCFHSFAVPSLCFFSPLVCCCVWRPGACPHFLIAVASVSFAVLFSSFAVSVLRVPIFSFRVLCVAHRVTFLGCCRVVSVPCAFLFLSVVAVVRFFRAPWCAFSQLRGALFQPAPWCAFSALRGTVFQSSVVRFFRAPWCGLSELLSPKFFSCGCLMRDNSGDLPRPQWRNLHSNFSPRSRRSECEYSRINSGTESM